MPPILRTGAQANGRVAIQQQLKERKQREANEAVLSNLRSQAQGFRITLADPAKTSRLQTSRTKKLFYTGKPPIRSDFQKTSAGQRAYNQAREAFKTREVSAKQRFNKVKFLINAASSDLSDNQIRSQASSIGLTPREAVRTVRAIQQSPSKAQQALNVVNRVSGQQRFVGRVPKGIQKQKSAATAGTIAGKKPVRRGTAGFQIQQDILAGRGPAAIEGISGKKGRLPTPIPTYKFDTSETRAFIGQEIKKDVHRGRPISQDAPSKTRAALLIGPDRGGRIKTQDVSVPLTAGPTISSSGPLQGGPGYTGPIDVTTAVPIKDDLSFDLTDDKMKIGSQILGGGGQPDKEVTPYKPIEGNIIGAWKPLTSKEKVSALQTEIPQAIKEKRFLFALNPKRKATREQQIAALTTIAVPGYSAAYEGVGLFADPLMGSSELDIKSGEGTAGDYAKLVGVETLKLGTAAYGIKQGQKLLKSIMEFDIKALGSDVKITDDAIASGTGFEVTTKNIFGKGTTTGGISVSGTSLKKQGEITFGKSASVSMTSADDALRNVRSFTASKPKSPEVTEFVGTAKGGESYSIFKGTAKKTPEKDISGLFVERAGVEQAKIESDILLAVPKPGGKGSKIIPGRLQQVSKQFDPKKMDFDDLSKPLYDGAFGSGSGGTITKTQPKIPEVKVPDLSGTLKAAGDEVAKVEAEIQKNLAKQFKTTQIKGAAKTTSDLSSVDLTSTLKPKSGYDYNVPTYREQDYIPETSTSFKLPSRLEDTGSPQKLGITGPKIKPSLALDISPAQIEGIIPKDKTKAKDLLGVGLVQRDLTIQKQGVGQISTQITGETQKITEITIPKIDIPQVTTQKQIQKNYYGFIPPTELFRVPGGGLGGGFGGLPSFGSLYPPRKKRKVSSRGFLDIPTPSFVGLSEGIPTIREGIPDFATGVGIRGIPHDLFPKAKKRKGKKKTRRKKQMSAYDLLF